MKRVTYKALQALVENMPFPKAGAYGVGSVGFAFDTYAVHELGFVEVQVATLERHFSITVAPASNLPKPVAVIMVPRVASEGMLKMTIRRLVAAIKEAAFVDGEAAV
jgi:hypothetical protein